MSLQSNFVKKGYHGKGKPMPKEALSSGFNNGFNGNKKQLRKDYNECFRSAKQASHYEFTMGLLIHHMKKDDGCGNDIENTLEELEPLNTVHWKPQMKVRAVSDESIQRTENRQFEIEFQTDYIICC
jgi:hypothetical protein